MKKKYTISSLKKKAPKVPPLTCIKIDNVISQLEKIVAKKKALNKKQLKLNIEMMIILINQAMIK